MRSCWSFEDKTNDWEVLELAVCCCVKICLRTWELLTCHPSNIFCTFLPFLAVLVFCDLEVVNAMGHCSCMWLLLRNLVALGTVAMTSKKDSSSVSRCIYEINIVPHLTCLQQDSLLSQTASKMRAARGKKLPLCNFLYFVNTGFLFGYEWVINQTKVGLRGLVSFFSKWIGWFLVGL